MGLGGVCFLQASSCVLLCPLTPQFTRTLMHPGCSPLWVPACPSPHHLPRALTPPCQATRIRGHPPPSSHQVFKKYILWLSRSQYYHRRFYESIRGELVLFLNWKNSELFRICTLARKGSFWASRHILTQIIKRLRRGSVMLKLRFEIVVITFFPIAGCW